MALYVQYVRPNVEEEAAATTVSFVAADDASTPSDGSTSTTGNTIVIPIPAGVQDGDLMFAHAYTNLSPNGVNDISTPSGWTRIIADRDATNSVLHNVYQRTASSEPSSYTWNMSSNDAPRGGNIIVLRNAASTLGDSATDNGTNNVPSVSSTDAGSALVAFIMGSVGDVRFSADAPMTHGDDHLHNVGGAYSSDVAGAVAYELDVGTGTISGRSFSNSNAFGLQRVAALLVEPSA